MAQSCRPHHHEFAFSDQPIEREQNGDECADRQHDVEKAWQDQNREIEEHIRRQAPIHDQIDQPKRLGKPDRRAECSSYKDHDAKALMQDVAV